MLIAWGGYSHPCPPKAAGVKSNCLRLATGAPWYVNNGQTHEDLGVPLFATTSERALTASFDSKLANVGNPPNPLVRQFGRYLR